MTRNYPDGLKPYAVTITVKHFSVVAAGSFKDAEEAAERLRERIGSDVPGERTAQKFVSAVPDLDRQAHQIVAGEKLVPLRIPVVRALAAPSPKKQRSTQEEEHG